MLHNGAVESTVCRHNGSEIARSRTPRAHQKLARAWSARARDLRAGVATHRGFNRTVAQRVKHAAQ
eukprot:11209301-Lingulodinium_polyedra.AAC.1